MVVVIANINMLLISLSLVPENNVCIWLIIFIIGFMLLLVSG